MFQYTNYVDKGKQTYGLTTFVDFTGNSGMYRVNSVDCFMRSNDVYSFNTPEDAEKFCKKVANDIKKLYDSDHAQLVRDINLYGVI